MKWVENRDEITGDKVKQIFVLSLLLLKVSSVNFQADQKGFPLLKGPYFGQKPPIASPEIFCLKCSPCTNTCMGNSFSHPTAKRFSGSLQRLRLTVRPWTRDCSSNKKRTAAGRLRCDSFFSIARKENGPCYSADGQRLYYQSRAPLSGNGKNKDIDIWYRERKGNGWSEAHPVGRPVNTAADESQPWVTGNGSIFFCRENETIVKGQAGGSDIYHSQYAAGSYTKPVLLGAEINSEFAETEPTMAPDNSYLLFISNRPGGFSRMMNLYVSFRTPAGGWTRARCLSHELRIENIWFPTLSYDGKYLFFCGGYPSPNDGYSDCHYYWLNTKLIQDLKTCELKQYIVQGLRTGGHPHHPVLQQINDLHAHELQFEAVGRLQHDDVVARGGQHIAEIVP